MLEFAIGIAGLVGVPVTLGLVAVVTQRSLGHHGYKVHGAAKRILLGIAGSTDPTTYQPLVNGHVPDESLVKAVIKDIASDTAGVPDEVDHFKSDGARIVPGRPAESRLANEPDHYRVLGVSPTATQAEIRAAYRRCLRETHPERGGDESEFNRVQAAWDTLSHPGLRREYDLLRFGRRAALRYGKSAGEPAGRKVRGWKVGPRDTGPEPDEVPAPATVPWHAHLRRGRVASHPAVGIETSGLVAAVLVWAVAGIGFCVAVFDSAAPAVTRAIGTVAILAWALIVVGQFLRELRRTGDAPAPLRRWQTATAVLTGVVTVWVAGPSHLLGWMFALSVLAGAFAMWSVRRVRRAIRLHRSVGAALRQFNAFGPAGTRPKADRPTGQVLREILTNLPAARLFVSLPYTETGRVPHAIMSGSRLALLCAPIGHQASDADAESLSAAVARLQEALPGAQVRGWVLWPTGTEADAVADRAAVDDIAVETAAGPIGLWLAGGGNYYDLDLLQVIRLRLAAFPSTRFDPTTSADRVRRSAPVEVEPN